MPQWKPVGSRINLDTTSNIIYNPNVIPAHPKSSNRYEFTNVTQTDSNRLELATANYERMDHPLKPSASYHNPQRKPLQTNRWWQNLVLGQGGFNLALYPYLMEPQARGFALSYPELVATSGYVISPFVSNWKVEAETNEPMDRRVVKEDDLSCTVQWGGKLTSYLVRGSPYVTLEVKDLKLKLSTIHAILDVQQSDLNTVVRLNNQQAWVFFAQQPIRWKREGVNELLMETGYSGVFRLALIPQPVESNLKVLDQYKAAYPMGGIVKYEFNDPDVATLNFQFIKGGDKNIPILHLALPHQQSVLSTNSNLIKLGGYRCIKGELVAVLGDTWTMKEPLTKITNYHSPNPIRPDMMPLLAEAVKGDLGRFKIESTLIDPYFFGKAVAKLARLILIAEATNQPDLIPPALQKLQSHLEPWLSGANANRFVYDQTWGGIVTVNGLKSAGADFGNGYYNDHHFHYGYFLYACSVVGKFDAGWLTKYRNPIMVLIKDIANWEDSDENFPRFRVKDFFDGHSWASGLFEFGDGKNQESTSESVNAYYGLLLLARSLKDTNLINLSRLLLSTEIRSCQTYWHMTDASKIYPDIFKSSATVGIVWGSKVDYATWFGNRPEMIHGIQMLPFTPISHELLDRDWIKKAHPIMERSLAPGEGSAGGGWRTFIYMAQAVLDTKRAYESLLKDDLGKVMDDGNTWSNTLYWLATQP